MSDNNERRSRFEYVDHLEMSLSGKALLAEAIRFGRTSRRMMGFAPTCAPTDICNDWKYSKEMLVERAQEYAESLGFADVFELKRHVVRMDYDSWLAAEWQRQAPRG
jgi:hypothetical protein